MRRDALFLAGILAVSTSLRTVAGQASPATPPPRTNVFYSMLKSRPELSTEAPSNSPITLNP